MKTIPPKALARLQELNKYVEIVRYDEQMGYCSDMSPSEFAKVQRLRVKQFNFLVEKLYEEITLFLIQDL